MAYTTSKDLKSSMVRSKAVKRKKKLKKGYPDSRGRVSKDPPKTSGPKRTKPIIPPPSEILEKLTTPPTTRKRRRKAEAKKRKEAHKRSKR